MSRQKVPYKLYMPSGVSEKVWIAVVEAWENGMSDREAAFRASKATRTIIRESDIKKWLNNDPNLGDLKDMLQTDILATAKLNIKERIAKGDPATSKWYLERKAPNEFSTKQAVAFEDAVVSISIEDKEKALKEMIHNFNSNEQ